MAMNRVRVNSDVELKDRLVAINRVTKVTKGGRTFTFAAIVVVGDGKGVIKPAAAGTGLKAGGAMRAVLESAGITDVIAKSKGSSNPHNLVKATISALTQMRDAYMVAGERGIAMDKVFNG